MKAQNLVDVLKLKRIKGDLSLVTIDYLSQDSRDIQENTLFFCIDGVDVDGHRFAKQAKEAGAVLFIASKDISDQVGSTPVVYVKDTKHAMALLANHFYDYPSRQLNMIGVTGTNGKTTVSHLIDWIFQTYGQATGVIGTLYRKYNQKVFETKNTTPDSLIMQRTLREMVTEHVEMCVSEVSSHSLYQGRTWGVDFNTAVFTNLTHEHLETHKTMEEYGNVKSLLFSQLGNAMKENYSKCAIVNLDDPLAEKLQYVSPVEVVTYSLENPEADFYADQHQCEADSTQFTLHVLGESYTVSSSLVGKFNIANMLAAIAAAYVNGIAIETSIQALASFAGVAGRMQVLPNKLGFHAIVDYAHTPDGLEKLIESLHQFTYKRLLIMTGHDGGNRDNSIRPLLGRLALDNADYVVFTALNPRGEDVGKITAEMIGDSPHKHYELVEDRKDAIYKMIELAQEGDVLVFIGKGHESYQIFDGYSEPFDEAATVAAALRQREATQQVTKEER